MHILHGTWFPEETMFAFWCEDAGLEPSYRKGRCGQIAPHPYRLSIENLLHSLSNDFLQQNRLACLAVATTVLAQSVDQ